MGNRIENYPMILYYDFENIGDNYNKNIIFDLLDLDRCIQDLSSITNAHIKIQ